MKVFVKGRGALHLGKKEFVAQGGEGAVYARGDVAYKIYVDPKRMIAPAKITELTAIDDDDVIKPVELLLDAASGRALGYSMRYVRDADRAVSPVCALVPRAARSRCRRDARAHP